MGGNQSCCCEQQEDNTNAVIPTKAATTSEYKHFGDTTDEGATFDTQAKIVAGHTTSTGISDGVPASSIALQLDRSLQANVGLNLDALDEQSAFVDGIVPGAIDTWNRTHADEEKLFVYDRILSVNGVRGHTEQILREMRQSLTWNLIVERPEEVKIHIDCTKNPSLGLDLKYSPKGGSLLIASIGDGAVKEWNATSIGEKILPRDRIIEVNGIRGTARKLLETATNVTTMDLVFLHYKA
mmetsp:Transcript_69714/g.145677  ORF Transcript_69714/g.145677 Transcript_69714/m.145677 type:complete len:240 (-) Transcript_69714:208-927(-)